MKVKNIIICIMIMMMSLHSKDYETAHRFKAGDVISADMFNEIFDKLSFIDKSTEMDALVGTWQCSSLANRDAGCSGDWTFDSNHLYQILNNTTITIVNDGNGTYSYTTSAPSPLQCTTSTANAGHITIKNGLLFFSDPAIQLYPKIVSETRFTATLPPISGFVNPYTMSFVCNKQNIPPIKPTLLKTELNSNTVTLTWQDNSNDETGFDIFRKDAAEGTYTLIKTVSSNNYSETLTNGTYWYRVQAKNNYGNSEGSNVVKVVINN